MSGYYPVPINNNNATVAPTVNDDETSPYQIGSIWCDIVADQAYMCMDNAVGVAVWRKLTVEEIGTITNVTGTSPIVSSGGVTPDISINPATPSVPGSMSAADKTKLDGIGASAEVDCQDIGVTIDSSTTSPSFVDMPGASLTTINTASTKYRVLFTGSVEASNANKVITMGIMVDGVDVVITATPIQLGGGGAPASFACSSTFTAANGIVIKGRWKIDGNTATIKAGVLSIYGVN